MKRYRITVPCKGCQNVIEIDFDAPAAWGDRSFPCKCDHCESDIEIQVKQGLMKKQLLARCQMKKHSEKLLTILGLEPGHAENYS